MVDFQSYVDVNVFVYWLGEHPTFGKTAYEWIKRIEDSPRAEYVTSSLTLYETTMILAGLTNRSLKDRELVNGVIEPITSLKGLKIAQLRPEDLTQATELMDEYDLDYEDAIHLATALRMGVKKIVSNDNDFDKTPINRVF